MSTIASVQPTSPAPLEGSPVPSLVPPELYRFTVDQYERMGEAGILTEDDRVELIDGFVVTKMGKKPPHVWAVDSVEQLMRDALGKAWCVRGESPARIPPFDEPEPDVVVARGTRATYLARHPVPADIVLIVEVSETTYHRDRGKKWDANARSGIPVYWIVNLAKRRVEVYTDPTPEGYGSRRDYHSGEAIPVIIDGQQLGQVAVDDILPPLPPEPMAEGNGA
jgi:Uma2 family endonuclease